MEMNNSQTLHGLYGSQISRTKAVGYCKLHCAHLTVATLKQHECLKKNCSALKKHEHSYWIERERKKEKKKANRMSKLVY
jgi:hypothetical protein